MLKHLIIAFALIVVLPIKKYYFWFKLKNKNINKLSLSPSATTTLESKFEGCNAISAHSFFSGTMGYGSYISDYCSLEGEIGRFCSIAPHVCSHRGIHPITTPFVATSPMFSSLKMQNGHTFAKKQVFDEMLSPIVIGNDCWICSNVFLCGGVKIGDGAVVYAGAVVTKDVPSYAIVAGVPAKVIKYRYDADTIKFLKEFKWWDMPISWLESNWMLLNDIEELKKYASLHQKQGPSQG